MTKKQINSEEVLTARNIVHRYRGSSHPSVDNLSLSIFQGEIFGLLGPNGAGKTTSISIFSTLLQPTEGDVFIHGIDIIKHPHRIRSLLGFVPQDVAVYSDLTGREKSLRRKSASFLKCSGSKKRQISVLILIRVV